MNKPTRVVGYVRVSSDQQADAGHSLEAQRDRMAHFALAQGFELVAIEVDAGESAGSLERPGLQRALGRLDSFEASALLVVKLDRLTRSIRDLGELIDTYFKDGQNGLISMSESIDTSSAGGRLMLNILMSVAQWERETICERTKAVMQHLKAAGKFTGGFPPYGWRVADGELVEDPDEQAVIRTARELRAHGVSLRNIAKQLPVNPNTGNPFSPSMIARML